MCKQFYRLLPTQWIKIFEEKVWFKKKPVTFHMNNKVTEIHGESFRLNKFVIGQNESGGKVNRKIRQF